MFSDGTDDDDVSSDFAAIRQRTRRKRLRRMTRTIPSCAAWVIVWVALIAGGLHMIVSAFLAGLVGAGVYGAIERRVREADD